MQTGTVATRVSTAAHSNNRSLHSGSIVVEDPRLRGWTLTASGGAWTAPSTDFIILSNVNGDRIGRGTVSLTPYRSHITYRSNTPYRGAIISGALSSIWDLGYQDLGVETQVVLPDASLHTCRVSSITINSNEELICFYASKLRNTTVPYTEVGIYVMRVWNDGAGHFTWGQPQTVFSSVLNDINNNTTQLFITLPRLFTLNNEYWITALECSKYAGIQTYHLCYFRSTDGTHWTDRTRYGYLAGVSTDSSQSSVGINIYTNGVTATSFTVDDLVDAYLVVSGDNLYIASNSGKGNFVAPATSLVGVTNSNRQINITPDVSSWSLNLPTAPGGAQGRYEVINPYRKFNNHALLRRGSLITHSAGYLTTDGNESLQLVTEIIDDVRQNTSPDNNVLSIVTRDPTKYLEEWHADIPWEYFSTRIANVGQFCDLTSLIVLNGQFRTNVSGELLGGFIDVNSNVDENLAFIHESPAHDGMVEAQFKITGTLTDHKVGITFQGTDNKNFWVAFYVGSLAKFALYKAVPTTSGYKLYKLSLVAISSTFTMPLDTLYWMRVGVWHDHVRVWSSSDGITWTSRIDYQSGAVQLTTNESSWGIALRSTRSPSGAIGNTDGSGGMYPLDSGGAPLYFALRVTAPSSASVLRRLAVIAAQEGVPSDLTIGVAKGNSAQPYDLTDNDNIVWSTSVPAEFFNAPDSPAWKGVSVPGEVYLDADATYWICVKFNSNLSAGQSWSLASQNATSHPYGVDMTKWSSDGVGWSSLANPNLTLAATMFCDIENGYAKCKSFRYISGELPQTLESIAVDIACKAGVASANVDDSPLSTTHGDCAITANVTLDGTESGFTFRGASGYKIGLNATTQKVLFYANSVLIASIDSLVYLPQSVSVPVVAVHWKNCLYVFVAGGFAGGCYDNSVTAIGTVGSYGAATFGSLRTANLAALQEYWVVDENESALQSLTKLLQKRRAKFFIQYNGKFRLSTFPARTSVDTYNDTLVSGSKTDSDRGWVSHLRPQGQYYADTWDANLLDSDGLRFNKQDYTDAFTDEQAMFNAHIPIRFAREQLTQLSINCAANPAIEREDCITVVNNEEGTNSTYIVSDINFDFQVTPDEPRFDMSVGLRKFIS